MTTDYKVYSSTPITWAPSGGTYALSLSSCTTSTTSTAWQGAKGDLGSPRGAMYAARFKTKFQGNPVAGGVVEIWWAASPASTAASSNPGGASGADAAYAGIAGGTIAASRVQCTFVGVLKCEATTAAQEQDVGVLFPLHEYGSPVIVNYANATFTTVTTDHVLTLTPIIDQAQ